MTFQFISETVIVYCWRMLSSWLLLTICLVVPAICTNCIILCVFNSVIMANKWTSTPTFTPASKAGTRFTYPGGVESWVDLCALITPRLGNKPTTAWSKVQCPNRCATKTPKHSSIVKTSLLCGRYSTNIVVRLWPGVSPWPACT